MFKTPEHICPLKLDCKLVELGGDTRVQKVQIYRTPGGYRVESQQKISQTTHFSMARSMLPTSSPPGKDPKAANTRAAYRPGFLLRKQVHNSFLENPS